ncbi:MAG: HNH endonuclease [Bacilli bacterium]|nr:HNH endonuclease [Bacilli bacterium]MBQ8473201.1 HNH endonuclease [Bacilli bacterium]
MQEIWKDIKGYEGLYKASNLGRIKSMPRHGTHVREEHILKQNVNRKGYSIVGLTKNSKTSTITVHRLVANAFIPNPNNLPQVDHINDNKKDNSINNLQWITNEDNMKKAWLTGARSIEKTYKRGKENCRAKIVNQYDLKNNYIRTWYCIRDIEKELGFDNRNISACCRNKRPTAYGYKWKYVDS